MRHFAIGILALAAGCKTASVGVPANFTDSVFTTNIEGPATKRDGAVFLVNYQKDGTIARVTPKGKVHLFTTLPEGSTGNGIRLDADENLFIADFSGHNVLRADGKTGAVTVFAHEAMMNQPNDLAMSPNGTLYASDPNWKNSTGQLWKIDLNGSTTLLEKNMGTTNGVEVSPDGNYLYVNESVQRKIWRYRILADGNITGKQLWHEFPDFGLDGMRCDKAGNLYVARWGKGAVVVLSPEGKLLKEYITIGKRTSNLTFSPDEHYLYVTLQDRGRMEKIRLKK